MANSKIVFDTSDLEEGLKRLDKVIDDTARYANELITDEVMRLSSREVPIRQGYLLASLGKEPESELVIVVGYNKVYAARLHEHPEYNFRNGRKGKYLIDPIVKNLKVFHDFMEKAQAEKLV